MYQDINKLSSLRIKKKYLKILTRYSDCWYASQLSKNTKVSAKDVRHGVRC